MVSSEVCSVWPLDILVPDHFGSWAGLVYSW